MQVFTCQDGLENMMTCIYTAWEWALGEGHDNVRLQREPVEQMELFAHYIHVDADGEKCRKVLRSIRHKIGREAYISVCYAAAHQQDALDDIYRFLRLGFAHGSQVTDMLTEPAVMRMMEIRRRVGTEINYFREFLRFDKIPAPGIGASGVALPGTIAPRIPSPEGAAPESDASESALPGTGTAGVFVGHMEPKNNIVYEVALHFADRMPSEYWIIVDDNRGVAAVHPADGEIYLRHLSAEEQGRLAATEQRGDIYRDLWRTFFDSIAIGQRKNEKCQRNLFPIWLRRHAPEFH